MDEFLENLIKHRLVESDQARQLVHLRWLMIKGTYVFAAPNPALRAEQYRYVEICVNVAVAFAVIVDEPIELQAMCKEQYRQEQSKIPAIAEALLENQLRGWKDWREAESPIAWVKDRAISIHERDHTHGGWVPERDALHRPPDDKTPTAESLTFDYQEPFGSRDVVPLEEVSEVPGEAHAMPRLRSMAVNALIAAVHDDEDLHAYTKLRLRGHSPRAAWERLGWATNRGQAVDRRFRRLRQKLKASGFEYQTREIELPPGLPDASCNVVKERLRIPVPRTSESTLSGRVVYEPRSPHAKDETTDFGKRQKANGK
jgi:hypothetical protein